MIRHSCHRDQRARYRRGKLPKFTCATCGRVGPFYRGNLYAKNPDGTKALLGKVSSLSFKVHP